MQLYRLGLALWEISRLEVANADALHLVMQLVDAPPLSDSQTAQLKGLMHP